MTLIEHYRRLDARLVAKGFPPTSQWWLDTLERFFARDARSLVARVGRRGGKSSTMCRVAVLLALAGDFAIPPGDTGVAAFISANRSEASARIRTIVAILDALGVKHRPCDGGVELVDKPIAFRVFAATISGVSGFTSICVVCDEVAKWKDADTGVNPATEVLASLRPTMATQPSARMFLISSPFGVEDAHAVAFDKGDTDAQTVAFAPTWIANPTITEADTERLEEDPKIRMREYGAIPGATYSTAFDVDHIPWMFERRKSELVGYTSEPTLILDPSNNTSDGDAFTSCVVFWQMPSPDAPGLARYRVKPPSAPADGSVYLAGPEGLPMIEPAHQWRLRPVLVLSALEIHEPGLDSDSLCAHLAWKAREYGAVRCVSDQREQYSLSGLLGRRGLAFESVTWSAPTKQDAVSYLRRAMRDRTIVIPPEDTNDHELATLKAELASYSERLTTAGNTVFGARRGHDDLAALLVTTAIADGQFGMLRGSPTGSPSGVRRYADGHLIATR